jgi:hypothetical protein
MTTGPIRFGFEVLGTVGDLLYFVHFGLLTKTFAASQFETSASVPVGVPQMSRPFLLGLRLVASSGLAGHCPRTAPSRTSMTTGPIRFEFGMWGQWVTDCILVHFGELQPKYQKFRAVSN